MSDQHVRFSDFFCAFAIYSLPAKPPIFSNMYPELIRPTGDYFAYWDFFLDMFGF